MSRLKTELSYKANFSEMIEDELTNLRYCTKELLDKKTNFYVAIGNFDEIDKPQPKPSETKLQLTEALANCWDIGEVMDKYPYLYIRHCRGLVDLFRRKTYNEPRPKIPPFVIYLCGPTACGKSRWAHEICEQYIKHFELKEGIYKPYSSSYKYMDNYIGQHCVIFDDYRKDCLELRELLVLLDRYHITVQ